MYSDSSSVWPLLFPFEKVDLEDMVLVESWTSNVAGV